MVNVNSRSTSRGDTILNPRFIRGVIILSRRSNRAFIQKKFLFNNRWRLGWRFVTTWEDIFELLKISSDISRGSCLRIPLCWSCRGGISLEHEIGDTKYVNAVKTYFFLETCKLFVMKTTFSILNLRLWGWVTPCTMALPPKDLGKGAEKHRHRRNVTCHHFG